MHKNIYGLWNTLKCVHKISANILKFICSTDMNIINIFISLVKYTLQSLAVDDPESSINWNFRNRRI